MAEDFIAQSELRPSKQKACFHAARKHSVSYIFEAMTAAVTFAS